MDHVEWLEPEDIRLLVRRKALREGIDFETADEVLELLVNNGISFYRMLEKDIYGTANN